MQIPSVTIPTLAIAGCPDRFPVRRIFCVGQNYADHAREMGNDPDRQQPFFFTKPADALVDGGGNLAYPTRTEDLHHEVELVLALGVGGIDVPEAEAARLVYGSAVGVDLTRRDLQVVAKSTGRPWDMAKGFDRSAPIGQITPGALPLSGAISFAVNDDVRQAGDLSDMIWSPAEILSILSTFVALAPGDLVFTGTPAGVGRLVRGDTATARIAGLTELRISVV